MLCHRLSKTILLLAVVAGGIASAVPILTPQGASMGFSLTNVISGAPGSTVDPGILGMVVNNAGQIVFHNQSNNTNYVIANVDNQVFSNPGTVLASTPSTNFPAALASAGGFLWASGGPLQKLTQTGAVIATFPSIPVVAGMATNPVTGHLVGISNEKLVSINVSGAIPVVTVIQSGLSADGITVAPDGSKAYLGIPGSNIVDLVGSAHAVSSYGNVAGVDGVGVIDSSNSFNGFLVVNTTIGNIVLVDPRTSAQTIIAAGTGYGDFVAPDPTTKTLLLSSSNSILRLACGSGCGSGPAQRLVSTQTPEPSTALIAGLALTALGLLFRRRGRG